MKWAWLQAGARCPLFLLCTNQECRGEAGGGFRGKEQSFSLLLRHLEEENTDKNIFKH